MGVTIVPAVLASSREDLERQLSELLAITDVVQINVADGKFARPATWPYAGGTHDLSHMVANKEMLPHWGHFRYEIDLMVSDPEAVIGQWIAVGASRLTIHVEKAAQFDAVLHDLSTKYGHDKDFASDLLSVGLSVGIEANLSFLDRYVDRLDYVQFMGVVRLGRHGEPFDKRVVDRIKEFRKKHPNIPIQVDGGVSRATAPALLDAGVSRLVVGSDLWRAENKAERYGELTALIEQYGIYE